MTDTVTFTIGGEAHVIGPLTLYTLKRCWSGAIARLAKPPTVYDPADPNAVVDDRFERMSALLEIVATALSSAGTPTSAEDLERRTWQSEWPGLDKSLSDLFRISGMVPEADPVGEAEAASLSTTIGNA